MKNKVIFFIALTLLACNKDPEMDELSTKTSTGEAFVIRNAFTEPNVLKTYAPDTSITQSQDANGALVNDTNVFDAWEFSFTLNVDFSVLRDFKLVEETQTPELLSFYTLKNNQGIDFRPDSSLFEINKSSLDENTNKTNYNSIVIVDAERDANAMYFASTGFFLEQYLDRYKDKNVQIGYYNNATGQLNTETLAEIDPTMLSFYEQTRNAAKESFQLFDLVSAFQLLNQIELGIDALPIGTTTNPSQLNILTYSLFDTVNLDTNLLNDINNKLSNRNIQLNIISLFPIPFMHSTIFKSNGFTSSELFALSNKEALLSSSNTFESLVERGYFSTSIVLQNTDLLINNIAKQDLNRYSMQCRLKVFSDMSIEKAKQQLMNSTIFILWSQIGKRIPIEIEISPEIR